MAPSDAVFHAGERALQAQAGMGDKLEAIGNRLVRDAMPDQHRELFVHLPMLVIGVVDEAGRPHASIVAGRPGFVSSPDDRTLAIASRFADGDPAAACVARHTPIGVLGIELASRRRNRANGVVTAHGADGFVVHIEQSFGNCPQYIQRRAPRWVERGAPRATIEGAQLSARAAAIIGRADTFFIATSSVRPGSGPPEGVDASHRGGKPGFVQIAATGDGTVLSWPEYRGNFFFNTLGNLAVHPRAGLAIPDFDTGELVLLDGTTELVADGPEVAAYPGARSLLRLRVRAGVTIENALPFAWTPPELAPQLTGTVSM